MNWFGTKVGADSSGRLAVGVEANAGVGKYLAGAKRTQDAAESLGEERTKKRKTGFGDFAGW
jgi:hypothetical protein